MKITRFLTGTLICMGIVLASLTGAAAIPAKINYQGVLKNAAGAKIDGTVDIDLSLLPLGGGTAVFSESHSGVSVVGGLFSLKIGGVNDMSAVSFDVAYELELTVDGDLLSPNTPLCSAPYALGVVGGAQGPQGKQGPAGNDGAAGTQGAQGKQGDPGPVGSEFWDGDIAGDIYKVNSGNVGIGTSSPTGLLHISGSEPSAIHLSGTRPGYARDFRINLQAGALSNGDPGMFLQTSDATAGLVRMRLDARGFLGISDLAPAARLHVNEAPNGAGELGGQLFRITGYEPSMQIEATRNATTWNIGANMSGTADNGMRLNIGNNHMGTAMAINQVGRVGIGLDLPVAKLHVMEMPENSGEQGLLFRITGREPTMQIEALRTGTTWNIGANYSGTSDNGMRLVIGNSDIGNAMVINQAGRVGIGAENPTAKLEVAGQVKITGGAPAAGRVLTSDADGLATWEDAAGGGGGAWEDDGTNAWRTSGSVGIGTDAPGALLHVNQSSNGLWAAKVIHTQADGPTMLISHEDTGANKNAILSLYTGSQGSTPVFLAMATGQVGINMPANDLYSNSSTKFFVVGTAKSAGWSTYSDARLKENIETVSNALDKVTRLRGVNYEWRADAENRVGPMTGRHLGMIAQEVETVVPEVVDTSDDGYKSINYDNLTGLLVEAIKDQQEMIKAQAARIRALETK